MSSDSREKAKEKEFSLELLLTFASEPSKIIRGRADNLVIGLVAIDDGGAIYDWQVIDGEKRSQGSKTDLFQAWFSLTERISQLLPSRLPARSKIIAVRDELRSLLRDGGNA